LHFALSFRHNWGRFAALIAAGRKEPMMPEGVLSLTPAAVGRVRHLLDAKGEGAEAIRIGVRTAGCSGLAYTLDFARAVGPGDEVIEADGVKIVIDAKAVMHLIGTEMDFVEDKLGASFKFTNPNETGRCGCGESFTV
jgi:iron-sulfur cluster assembly protein